MILLALIVCLFAAAQTPQPPGDQPTVIRVSTNLVNVPVSVTDPAGQPVRNLAAGDFAVTEEGRPQKVVTLGEPGKTPVALAIIFDISGSVSGRFEFEQRAAADFLRTVLKSADTVSVFTVGMKPTVVQPQTGNLEAAILEIKELRPTRQATAFYDTVVEAARYLRQQAGPGTRRVVLAISDGEDNQSKRFALGSAAQEIQRNECTFYSINPAGGSAHLNIISMKGQDAMATLAAETGGAFMPAGEHDLDDVFRRISADLQAQYLLGYYSGDQRADGAYRRIAVRIPNRPELRIRARQGYYAPRG